ncbi:hypothetical protein KUTeg_023160 [Tegillarca granosa]|uniref:CWH43-like N-terminal domain-containing protein n=1 Tax=Tegillarca granosa TaxID=220873 RepID=A0ABQ9E6G4_TEGGR|nr:hypothetical protein KUTeg_023160 [Tegillarca granosa]
MKQRFGRLLSKSLFILPVTTCVWTVIGFVIPYGVAVAHNHTYAVFPYISNTGIYVPERGIFSLFVSVAALLRHINIVTGVWPVMSKIIKMRNLSGIGFMSMNALMRFQYVKLCLEKNRQSIRDTNPATYNSVLYRRLTNLNKTGLGLNLLASFGLLMVASFQVKIMDAPHYFGAFLTFVLGAFCCWIQTFLTYKKEDRGLTPEPKLQKKTFIFSTCIAVYRLRKKAGHGTKYHIQKHHDTLRATFLMSSFSEWFLALSIIAFFLTFIPGFRRMEFMGVNVTFKKNEKEMEFSSLSHEVV